MCISERATQSTYVTLRKKPYMNRKARGGKVRGEEGNQREQEVGMGKAVDGLYDFIFIF